MKFSSRRASSTIGREPVASDDEQLALDVLTAALALSLWVASGSLTLAVLGGLGEHPLRRLLLGLFLTGGCLTVLLARRPVAELLRSEPRWIIVGAGLTLTATALDDPIGGPYISLTLSAVGVAVVVAPARLVWTCVGLLMVGSAGAAFLTASPSELSGRELGGVLGQVLGYPLAAIVLLAFVQLLQRFVGGVDTMLTEIRADPVPPPRALEPGANPMSLLTASEREITQRLSRGQAPKQIAVDLGITIATVRTHIRNIKRKTGARTLQELAGLTVAFGLASPNSNEH